MRGSVEVAVDGAFTNPVKRSVKRSVKGAVKGAVKVTAKVAIKEAVKEAGKEAVKPFTEYEGILTDQTIKIDHHPMLKFARHIYGLRLFVALILLLQLFLVVLYQYVSSSELSCKASSILGPRYLRSSVVR